MMNPGDGDILKRLASDLESSYEELMSMYWQQLKMFALRRTGSLQDAEDIVQEAFLRAYLALERYTPQQIYTLKARPWLYKITWSVYCNYTGRSKAPSSISLDMLEEETRQEIEENPNEQPEQVFEQVERRQELEKLVETLPQHYRDVISMYYFEELTHQEIADILGQPVGNVRVHLHRGLKRLQKILTAQTNRVGQK
jgi:RNA polymerase sigma-70 factor, ECF subfamily